MSADDETENFRVYYHRNHVYAFAKPDEHGLDSGVSYTLTEDLVREFQSIIDTWKSGQ